MPAPQAELIPHCVVTPPAARVGRGATPVTFFAHTLPEPNPAGLYELTFRFRRLSHWTDARLQTVRALLAHYFAELGGFRIANDKAVRCWYDALDHYSEQQIRWAIDAKAASLGSDRQARAEKLQWVAHPVRFMTGESSRFSGQAPTDGPQIDKWLGKSAPVRAAAQKKHAEHRTQQAVAATQRKMRVIRRERREEAQAAAVEAVSQKDRRVVAAGEADRRTLAQWNALDEFQRLVGLARYGPAFEQQCRAQNLDPAGERQQLQLYRKIILAVEFGAFPAEGSS